MYLRSSSNGDLPLPAHHLTRTGLAWDLSVSCLLGLAHFFMFLCASPTSKNAFSERAFSNAQFSGCSVPGLEDDRSAILFRLNV